MLHWLSNDAEQENSQIAPGHLDGGTAVLVDRGHRESRLVGEAEDALVRDAERLRPQPDEQQVIIDINGRDLSFPASVDDQRWNGFACPYFRRPVAEAVVAWVNQTYRRYPAASERAYWDGTR